ncbi:unnamed protein product [Phytophthora fragariaefolia]|uniref:Unnamed protein product n=1 Tax=Phytophthora fragariaefolia TaxID=1490495 RepID=A0A9W7D7T2_9STRA|nr:unnamed protein product [Phytophthora fragariaefolia]
MLAPERGRNVRAAHVHETAKNDGDDFQQFSATVPKETGLSTFYDMLAKTPALRGKMPVAALNGEELAEQAAIAESELDGNRDEDYDESAEAKPNDDAEYLEATTPPATPRSNPSPKRRKTKKTVPKQAAKATGKRKRAALTERSAVKRPRTESLHLSGIDSACRYVTGVTRTVAIRKRNALTWADAGRHCTTVCKRPGLPGRYWYPVPIDLHTPRLDVN